MYEIGLKLWSTNKNYIEDVKKLFTEKLFDYIELYTVPNSYNEHIDLWKNIEIPFIIHAPHFREGMNLAKKENYAQNTKLTEETIKWADTLNSETIIFHPGIDGDIKATTEQFNKLFDPRMLVENKPYYALDDDLICNGYSPKEIEYILANTNIGFCLDLGHAIYAANAKNNGDYINYLKAFIKLKPTLFHLSDGDIKGNFDCHDHFGQGSFDIKLLLDLLPKNQINKITIETKKDSLDNLDCFRSDIQYLRKITG
jgi:deoxyribonuclease IV